VSADGRERVVKTARAQFSFSREIQRTAAPQVHRPLDYETATDGCGSFTPIRTDAPAGGFTAYS
jgi:hypothetical protein